MLRRTALFLLACSWSVTAALAQPGPSDPRIQHLVYNADDVYRLDLFLKSVTALQFSDGEDVGSILIGDSASWEVVKLNSGNVVSVKPIIASSKTNMTIYTNSRVYTFELHCLAELGSGAEQAPYRMIFSYPQDAKPKRGTERPAVVQLDSNYLVSGQAEFRPVRVQDDGRHTKFFLREGAPHPAIFKVGPNHDEQLINSRTVGNQIVVDGTSDYWVMRIDNKVVCIGHAKEVNASARLVDRPAAKDATTRVGDVNTGAKP